MKKLFCFISLLMAFNVFAQGQLNMNAVFSGRTNDVVCYLYSQPSAPEQTRNAECGNKNGSTGNTPVNSQTQRVIADFVGTGNWNLSATFMGAKNTTVFVFTKK